MKRIMTGIMMSLTHEQQEFLSNKLNGKITQENCDETIVKIGDFLYSSNQATCGVFVDLPNGNKGMILVKVLDFDIKTGNPTADKIVRSSYEVDLPEIQMALLESEVKFK